MNIMNIMKPKKLSKVNFITFITIHFASAEGQHQLPPELTPSSACSTFHCNLWLTGWDTCVRDARSDTPFFSARIPHHIDAGWKSAKWCTNLGEKL
jgi:hypothetical protein